MMRGLNSNTCFIVRQAATFAYGMTVSLETQTRRHYFTIYFAVCFVINFQSLFLSSATFPLRLFARLCAVLGYALCSIVMSYDLS